ncbi:MAG: 4-hydroxy-3-methylbut-2-enyl diphosphate reductase [Gemmatimonadetes bacterium GWC2_71_10]|nr:MAG: 4-hydroxy-3-methylbut-2-enyl diphosphate reductase [Gemmatimonadetes bacterium GWC2_71_10]
MQQTYFRKGFGLKSEIEGELSEYYHSALVNEIRANGNQLTAGDVTVKLAHEFGFCYGVDRAVEYAYESRKKFPDKGIFLVGEIIHNPHVNARLRAMGIVIIEHGKAGDFDFSGVTAEDVVILPAFGVTKEDFDRLRGVGCVLVDTTCGSVLNVWKRVESYARDGFTAVIHGKYFHEETKATASQVGKYPGGKYLVVRDMGEARLVCDFIERGGADTEGALATRFAKAVSPSFSFARDLERIGVANQTTMLSSESLAIAAQVREAMARRWGEADTTQRFRSFDTICSATQDRQDAVIKMLETGVDVAVVIGGYNSSNTNHLAALCAKQVRTFHVEDSACIDPGAGTIRYLPVGQHEPVMQGEWMPQGPVTVGVTAGASTPNNKVGEAIERVFATRGVELK